MKKIIAVLLVLLVLPLAGCAQIDTKLERAILEKSGILEHEDYIQFQQYQESGMLNEDGHYTVYVPFDNSDSKNDKPKGQIHVTFADNRYLKIAYYTDSSMTFPIDTTSCYLNPGDTIYARVVECINPNSNLYRLAEYRIVEYGSDGNKKDTRKYEVADSFFEYTIPANFIGTEISVVAIGEYPDRDISMNVFYVDDVGSRHSLGNAGAWAINNTDVEGDVAKISPIESYVLKFTYDTENYFYVGSEPACFTKNPESTGFVEFLEAEPTDADITYSVELHPFLKLSLKSDEEAKVCINNGSEEIIKKNKVWNSGKLKYGDSIIVETMGECTIVSGDYQHISASKDPIADGYRYTLKVVQEVENNTADVLTLTLDVNRFFNVTLSTDCAYGDCTYKLDGDVVSGIIQVREGQKLTLTYNITNENYSFADKSKGVTGFLHDLFNNSERTITIPIDTSLEDTTVIPDEWFDIIEKGD